MKRGAAIRGITAGLAALAAGCAGPGRSNAGPKTKDGPAPPSHLVEVFPGIRADPRLGVVEFDGRIAVDCHDPQTPDVYLEVVCCARDSREHESLVVTEAPASLVHAALLMVGAEPGHPGGWRRDGDRIEPFPPTGDTIGVELLVVDESGGIVGHAPGDWIRDLTTGRPLAEIDPDDAWVFAGSRVRRFNDRDVYDADGTGQIIGLHTFGSETIAWRHVESPESAVDEPRWLAIDDLIPPIGTPVTIRLRRIPEGDGSR